MVQKSRQEVGTTINKETGTKIRIVLKTEGKITPASTVINTKGVSYNSLDKKRHITRVFEERSKVIYTRSEDQSKCEKTMLICFTGT